jgi:hypothetical protein
MLAKLAAAQQQASCRQWHLLLQHHVITTGRSYNVIFSIFTSLLPSHFTRLLPSQCLLLVQPFLGVFWDQTGLRNLLH